MSFLTPSLFARSDDYTQARHDSEQLDLLLGVNVPAIEEKLLQQARLRDPQGSHKSWGPGLHQGNQTWVGLSHQTLQTPYSELIRMCELLNLRAGSLVVDLGAGYGRMGLVLEAFYPEVNFLGLEFVCERVVEGARIFEKLRCRHARIFQQDLCAQNFEIPEAEYYFIYDYGTLDHIRRTLKQFEDLSERRSFKLVARGTGVRNLIHYEQPWLANLAPAIHQGNFSVYSMSEDL